MISFIKRLKKRSDIFVDLGKLQQKGIIRMDEEPRKEDISRSVDKAGYLHLSRSSPSSMDSAAPETSTGESALGFLGSMASVSNASSNSNYAEESTGNLDEKERRRARIVRKFEEMDGKINDTSNKIYHLLERIDLLERKIERLERKSGY